MTKKKVPAQAKAERKSHSPEFKQHALLCAVKDGVPRALRDLGLEPAQLQSWRPKAQQQGQDAQALQLQQSEVTLVKQELA